MVDSREMIRSFRAKHPDSRETRGTVRKENPFPESDKGGVENSGEGKTYHKTPPQKRFWTPPPPIICSAFPICPCPVTSLIPLSEASRRVFWRGALYKFFGGVHSIVFFTSQDRMIRFPTPPCRCPTSAKRSGKRGQDCKRQSFISMAA